MASNKYRTSEDVGVPRGKNKSLVEGSRETISEAVKESKDKKATYAEKGIAKLPRKQE